MPVRVRPGEQIKINKMKTIVRKVYECEHCGKKMLAAGPMARHEKYCKANPDNKHKCFDFCKHLKRTGEVVFDGGEPNYKRTVFTCEVTGKEMYSFLLEKKASLLPNHIKLDKMERMPLSCDDFKTMHIEELEERFSDFL